MEYVFEADNISKSYSKKQVLKNISFHLKISVCVSVLGLRWRCSLPPNLLCWTSLSTDLIPSISRV